jgi:hypothetical protein
MAGNEPVVSVDRGDLHEIEFFQRTLELFGLIIRELPGIPGPREERFDPSFFRTPMKLVHMKK